MVLTLARLGWKIKDLVSWETDIGLSISIDSLCPRAVKTLAHEAVDRMNWKVAVRNRPFLAPIGGRPLLEPIKAMINKSPGQDWGRQHMGMVTTVAAMGIWPMDRLKEAGYHTQGLCACGCPQTVWHLVWDCPLTRPFRVQYDLDQNLVTEAWRDAANPLYTTGLMRDPTIDLPGINLDVSMDWVLVGTEGRIFCGPTYGDGSG